MSEFNPNETSASGIEFHGEQDGGTERELKRKLVDVLTKEPMVQRAYLARITVGKEKSVALCMYAPGANEEAVVDKISGVFAGMFKKSQQLDMLFLEPVQVAAISKVCRAFYPPAIATN